MTITAVLAVYAALIASLALGISLLILRVLPEPAPQPGIGGRVSWSPGGLEPGSRAQPIVARASTGQHLDSTEFAGRPHLVAFLSGSCPGCRTSLPSLAGYVGRWPGSLRLIAVIVGDPRQGTELEQSLAPIATVVFEPDRGPIAAAYRVVGFPCYVLVSASATVLASSASVLDLPLAQPQ